MRLLALILLAAVTSAEDVRPLTPLWHPRAETPCLDPQGAKYEAASSGSEDPALREHYLDWAWAADLTPFPEPVLGPNATPDEIRQQQLVHQVNRVLYPMAQVVYGAVVSTVANNDQVAGEVRSFLHDKVEYAFYTAKRGRVRW